MGVQSLVLALVCCSRSGFNRVPDGAIARPGPVTPIGKLHDFLDSLPSSARAELDAVSTFRSLPQDSTLLRAGTMSRDIYQLRAGRVKYSCWDYKGRETVLTYMAGGDWIGLSEVFTGLPALWNVVAQSPVQVRVISSRDFDALIDAHPVLARQLLRLFALRFSLYRLFGMDHSALSLKERLVKMLYVLSFSHEKHAPDDQPIRVGLSQEELGKVVGASRQKLNPALKALAKEGLLEVQFGGLTLRSRACIVEHYGHLLDTDRAPNP
jgi:CRP-like cAMP-binding protein